jgi:tripartite-type tricarboxylate transporter receptor subunit TctC
MRFKVSAITMLFVAGVPQVFAAAAPDFPTKPIRLIVPVAPGGGSDQIGRIVGQQYTEAWGQQVVIDNRAGAGQVIGTEMCAKAPPDGYTVVVINPSHAINATLMRHLPYDAIRDFAPVTLLATQPYAVVVTLSLPAKNVKELVAMAKAKPREVSYASAGPGSASHLATEMFLSMAGIEMTHVPYKGTGPAMPDLIAGRVQIMINPILAVANQVQAGRLRAIAVTSQKRSASLPSVPTVAESGVPGYQALAFYALLAPAKTPPSVVTQLNAEAVKAMAKPDVREVLSRSGTDALGSTPREALEFVKGEVERWGKVIRQANVKVE